MNKQKLTNYFVAKHKQSTAVFKIKKQKLCIDRTKAKTDHRVFQGCVIANEIKITSHIMFSN